MVVEDPFTRTRTHIPFPEGIGASFGLEGAAEEVEDEEIGRLAEDTVGADNDEAEEIDLDCDAEEEKAADGGFRG